MWSENSTKRLFLMRADDGSDSKLWTWLAIVSYKWNVTFHCYVLLAHISAAFLFRISPLNFTQTFKLGAHSQFAAITMHISMIFFNAIQLVYKVFAAKQSTLIGLHDINVTATWGRYLRAHKDVFNGSRRGPLQLLNGLNLHLSQSIMPIKKRHQSTHCQRRT